MKIAYIGTRGFFSRYGGIEVSLHEIAIRLAKIGHEVTVYCWKSNERLPQPPPNIRLVYIPTFNSKHFGTFFYAMLSTAHVLFSDADIVHYQALGPSIFAIFPRLFGKKVVVTIHSLDWKRRKWNIPAKIFLRFCEFPAVFAPNITIVVSSFLKGYYESRFSRVVNLIPNGVNFSPAPREAGVVNKNLILFVGRLVPEKRVDCLIEAFKETASGMELVIAGESGYDPGYISYIHKISRGSDSIRFLGQLGGLGLDELYRRAYVFILPSEVEGSSLSLLEAMSYGICPLISDIPECREIARESGTYFKTGDLSDLAEKMKFLVDHPEIVEKKGILAKKIIVDNYNWEIPIKRLDILYASLKVR